jgi:hypothetical protein
MPNTMTLISTITVGSGGSSSIDFTSIPSTYTDLCLKLSARDGTYGAASSTCYVAFNGTSRTNQTSRWIANSSGTPTSPAGTDILFANIVGNTGTANTFSNGEMYITNYAGSNNKSLTVENIHENNSSTIYNTLFAGLWSSSAAINRIYITCDGAFAQYSTASLYGISNS